MTGSLRLAAALLIALALPGIAAAQDFTIHTQNLLRFGQGTNTATKCAALNALATANTDIILIQELMPNNGANQYPCPGGRPANFAWISAGPYGTAAYQEYYGFLYRTNATSYGATLSYMNVRRNAPKNSFMRPPVALLFRIARNGVPNRFVWIANYHAIWGTAGVGGRRAEVQQVGPFFDDLRHTAVPNVPKPATGYAVIIGGDWNLRTQNAANVRDPGFNWISSQPGNNQAGIQPNDRTTLNAQGNASSAYDHFVFAMPAVTVQYLPSQALPQGSPWRIPPPPSLVFRQTVSDHLGVSAAVAIQ